MKSRWIIERNDETEIYKKTVSIDLNIYIIIGLGKLLSN